MDHHRNGAAKAALVVALIVFAVSAQAEVNWNIVGTAPGEPDLVGTAITPNVPVSCSFGPPAGCPISGTLTIPAGALGGPGTAIDIGADPANVIVNIATSPPTATDDFFLLTISKDGYTCNSSSSFVFQCGYDSTVAFYSLVLAEQVPQVSIGNGNVSVTGEIQVGGKPVCAVGACTTAGVTTLTCGSEQVEISCTSPQTLYAIGDTGPGGGLVFHVTDGGLHGLEAAPANQGQIGWGCDPSNINGADGTAVGTGHQNTLDILAGCGDRAIGASLAVEYALTVATSGWFLPSKDELNLMYQNIGQGVDNPGGFFNADYLTSSETGPNTVWMQDFGSNGFQIEKTKTSTAWVRAIRAF